MITEQNMTKISDAIGKAEQKTTGEIVCVLTKQSDDYRYIPILWAAIAALAVPLLFLIYDWAFVEVGSYAVEMPDPYIVYFAQLCVFLIGYFAFQWRVLKFALLPKTVTQKRAKRLAAEQFVMQKIHLTDERTGVLLFISVGEKYVEIIADHGIAQKLDEDVWQGILDALIVEIKADNMNIGIVNAVEQVGALLQTHFPVDSAVNLNELPNHLIILD